ncbi:hypothetical protein [Haloterrigena salinisoli]
MPDDVAEQIRIDAIARGVQTLAEIAAVPFVFQDRLQNRRSGWRTAIVI